MKEISRPMLKNKDKEKKKETISNISMNYEVQYYSTLMKDDHLNDQLSQS